MADYLSYLSSERRSSACCPTKIVTDPQMSRLIDNERRISLESPFYLNDHDTNGARPAALAEIRELHE